LSANKPGKTSDKHTEHQKTQRSRRGLGSSRAFLTLLVGLAAITVVIVGIGLLNRGTPSSAQAGSPAASPTMSPVQKADRIDLVYFHRTQRCDSCLWVGTAARQAMETYFKDELASGKVTFQEVDVQKPENAALAKQYRATGSSLYMNYYRDGVDNIREARDTYPMVGNWPRFSERLRASIEVGLGKGL
jgi:hypothetical protein